MSSLIWLNFDLFDSISLLCLNYLKFALSLNSLELVIVLNSTKGRLENKWNYNENFNSIIENHWKWVAIKLTWMVFYDCIRYNSLKFTRIHFELISYEILIINST